MSRRGSMHEAPTSPRSAPLSPTSGRRPRVTRLRRLLPQAPLLGTGAGHDAGILAAHGIPSAMLFVRNPTGVSHSPEEHAETDDCQRGVRALAAVVAGLMAEPPERPGLPVPGFPRPAAAATGTPS